MAVGRPAAEHDAVNAQGADRQNEEQADVQVGDLEDRAKRQRGVGQQRHGYADQRRQQENDLVGFLRDNIFFDQKL